MGRGLAMVFCLLLLRSEAARQASPTEPSDFVIERVTSATNFFLRLLRSGTALDTAVPAARDFFHWLLRSKAARHE